jgi:hypothetical protein
MTEKREIRASIIVKDIRSGMAPGDVMKKHRLTVKGLNSVMRKLVAANVVTTEELGTLSPAYGRMTSDGDLRQFERKTVRFPLVIRESDNPQNVGFVRNLSDKGISVEGIEGEIGKEKGYNIRSSELAGNSTIEMKAKCIWLETNPSEDDEIIAGLEITEISNEACEELKKIYEK